MSSPPCQSENTAAPAPVSRGHAAATAGAAAAVAGPEEPAAITGPASADALSHGTPVPHAALADHATALPAQLDLPAPADQNKKSRPPALASRSATSSLLTQALASARGIPSTGQPDPTSASQKPAARSHDALGDPSRQDQKKSPVGASKGGSETSDASHGDSLMPRGSPSTEMASTALTTTTAPTSEQSRGSLELAGVGSKPRGYRDAACVSEAGVKPDKLRGPREISSRTDLPVPNASTIQLVSSPTQIEGEAADALPVSRPPRPRKMEHRLSMGPEKAWSIGTGELDSTQDGQVEKSITEVLSGLEPNRGSRKASHSLRFFKEGLPDEKIKRRESKLAVVSREKLPTPSEASGETDSILAGDVYAQPGVPSPHRLDETAVKARSVPVRPPVPATNPPTTREYLDELGKDERRPQIPASEQDVAPLRNVGVHTPTSSESAAVEATHPDRRESGEGSEHGESAEDGDDSGEEKISSALFLPHQGPPEPQDLSPSLPGASKRAPAVARTLSRGEDFHPWLVKAGEPEADRPASEEQGLEEGFHGIVTEPPAAPAEEVVVEEAESTEASAARLSRPVSQHYEDHVHEHQLGPREPLDAIELIPYKHQVGGHTTLWRFSKRAVCKQLNNRENEFYERIERDHRDLLPFLPR